MTIATTAVRGVVVLSLMAALWGAESNGCRSNGHGEISHTELTFDYRVRPGTRTSILYRRSHHDHCYDSRSRSSCVIADGRPLGSRVEGENTTTPRTAVVAMVMVRSPIQN